ncbi:hypothetical protein HYH03_017474 [Edaphochlamys debaryana]|uniref:JmjC domain-containing protein n=1 Tax=Edaphochlamys debaryana TaxID=47281 RepID=A0A836BNV5_9CHLO|nr:hypothetical protein HYH03_017474 [Edaphochlamys debaryana]|eukprot:KAG2483671.1 hypothetical protein HYH03_017474 [Edaphochlamys debaryana]
MEAEALPEGVLVLKLPPKALAVASSVLQAVKDSRVPVTQLLQDTGAVPDAQMNGVLSTKELPLGEQYRKVRKFSGGGGKALYMHNKALIEVVGHELCHQLYAAVQPLDQDVLVNYPLLYVSDNPKSSSDVLVGSADSWSPLHQDLPLYCTSVILVLEGHKEFVLVSDEVAASLRVNITSSTWAQPVAHGGRLYPDLQSLVRATGGSVLSLRCGDMLVMPPRVFHLARNRAPTVSCNFSVCTMDSVPLTLAQTLARIEQSPQDVMHFDRDFARLLEDCTTALLASCCPLKPGGVQALTARRRLPPVQAVLDGGVRLMEWYLILQCIPNGWVQGFWGDVRNRVLAQLQAALPMHAPAGGAAAAGGTAAGALGRIAAGAASVPRPLSGGRAVGAEAPPVAVAAGEAAALEGSPPAGGAGWGGGGPAPDSAAAAPGPRKRARHAAAEAR